MNNTEKNKIKWTRIIRPMAISLVLVFLLSYATFAWMKRDWTPTLYQDNVKIAAGSSLTFIYVKDEEEYNIEHQSVNSLLGMNNFVFKSVSNCTGKSGDFFGLFYAATEQFDRYNYLDVQDDNKKDMIDKYGNPYTALGVVNGYIEMKFTVSSDINETKGIYLSKDSFIEGAEYKESDGNVVYEEGADANPNNVAAEAMRVSVTVHNEAGKYDDNNDMTYIFARTVTDHSGITNDYEEGYGYKANEGLRKDQSQYMKDSPNGSTSIKNMNASQKDAHLFDLAQGEVKELTVRIWLEGTDENCTDAIADSALSISLQFTAGDAKNP